MSKNLKMRIYTSLILFLVLSLIMINNYVLGYVLIVAGLFSIFEFSNMISIIYKKFIFKRFIYNLLFIIYVFIFCSVFLVLSNFPHIKLIIFIILFSSIFSDIGGYIFGKIFKGPKLTNISPKKTISGSVGSLLLCSLILSTSIYFLTNNINLKIMLIGFSISIASQIGDLFFSYLKRKSFLKDTGNFLPGHGGILDRVDSLLLGLPVGIISLLIIY